MRGNCGDDRSSFHQLTYPELSNEPVGHVVRMEMFRAWMKMHEEESKSDRARIEIKNVVGVDGKAFTPARWVLFLS
jgi:hypothetical protein